MSVTFDVSPEVAPPVRREEIDHEAVLGKAFRKPFEAMWKPARPLVACDDDHALVKAVHDAFYLHHPLVHAEEMRHRFVMHEGKEKILVQRMDFFPGQDNPWAEAFEEFSHEVGKRVGKLQKFIRCDFSTTGPTEYAVSDLMVMDTFQAYFEYEMRMGCGIPSIKLTGTVQDWKSIRDRARLFAEYGLEDWSRALDPVLGQFVSAAEGKPDVGFWKSFFRYHGGSGPPIMTGWIYVLFPYLKKDAASLYPNPYLHDWKERLEKDQELLEKGYWATGQGVAMRAVPPALASVPVKVAWGILETEMRFVGGLIGLSQDPDTLALEPQCGWAILYDEPEEVLSQKLSRYWFQRVTRWSSGD